MIPTLSDKPTVIEVRDALLAAGHELATMRNKPAGDRTENFANEVREVTQFINDGDLIFKALERGERVLPDPGTGILPPGATPNYGPLATQVGGDFRSTGQIFTADEGYQSFAKTRQSAVTSYEVELEDSPFSTDHWRMGGSRAKRTPITSATGAGDFRPVGQPIPPTPRQMRMFLRDILNVQQTTLASIPYIREVAPTASEYGASAVAEGTAKPEVAMDWVLDEAMVRKIAAWVPVTSEIIDDAPTLMGYIDGRLAYLLAVREEFEILRGDGTAPHLKGILSFSEVQTQTFVSSDPMATIGRAIGKVEVVDGDADGLAIHPTDFWTMITTRYATSFDGAGAGPLPFTNAAGLTPWGLPTVRSRALTAGQALVGCWQLGATLWDRMQTTYRVGNQHSDFFINNKVAVLVEERVALTVHRPDFFVKTNIV